MKTPECWGSDANAHALRVEHLSGSSVLIPFDQFLFADFRHGEGEQTLRAVFGTHEVLIRGVALRRLATALQRRELAFVCTTPTSSLGSVADGQAVIWEISLIEVKNDAAKGEGQTKH